jgi:peptidoglycan/xylan/chitin deacetylase (PgdA/CDA1 family)
MRRATRALVAAVAAASVCAPAAQAAECRGILYLTIDTGSMSQAEAIAATLAKHGVKATFFLANEKTVNGDRSLDPAWAPYWKARAAEGHAFGSHTWDHGYFRGDLPDGKVKYVVAGKPQTLDGPGVCAELRRSEARFREFTGRGFDPIWRAPGGYTTPNAIAAARACGFEHVGWASAGFLGDELPSDKYPNEALLKRALANLRDGDVMVMHTGIWSRKEPFAPMLDPLLAGLKAKGYCFATLPERARQVRAR